MKEGKREGSERIIEAVAENSPNVMENINPHIQESQWTPSGINSRDTH